MGKHRIVVSAENNGYIGWQRKVFYYSCVTRTSFQPLFIVHAMGSEWHPDFHELVKAGALVRSAPRYIRIPLDFDVPTQRRLTRAPHAQHGGSRAGGCSNLPSAHSTPRSH